MVYEGNRTQGGPTEILSDHGYEYDRGGGGVRLAARELEKEKGMER